MGPHWEGPYHLQSGDSEQPYPMLSAVFCVIPGQLSQGTMPMLRNFLWEDVGRETSRTNTYVVEQDI